MVNLVVNEYFSKLIGVTYAQIRRVRWKFWEMNRKRWPVETRSKNSRHNVTGNGSAPFKMMYAILLVVFLHGEYTTSKTPYKHSFKIYTSFRAFLLHRKWQNLFACHVTFRGSRFEDFFQLDHILLKYFNLLWIITIAQL